MTPGDSEANSSPEVDENAIGPVEEGYDPSVRRTLMLSTVLFAIALSAGYVSAFLLPVNSEGQGADDIMSGIRDLIPGLAELTRTELAAFIFVNNAVKSLAVIILGLSLGTIPVFFLVLNGGLIGLVVNISIIAISPSFIFAALIPHGVLEIPAILYAAALSFKVAGQVWRSIRKRRSFVKKSLTTGIKSFLKVVLPMLLLAAVIEAFVTPEIISLVTSR